MGALFSWFLIVYIYVVFCFIVLNFNRLAPVNFTEIISATSLCNVQFKILFKTFQNKSCKMCLCFKVYWTSCECNAVFQHTLQRRNRSHSLTKELLYFVRWGVKKEEGLVRTRAHTICFTHSQVFTHRLCPNRKKHFLQPKLISSWFLCSLQKCL